MNLKVENLKRKEMKKNFKFAFLPLCAMLVLNSSCSGEDVKEITPEVGNFGEIKFDRTKFGYGQTITASCQLPSVSSSIPDLIFTWYNNGSQGLSEEKNGVSYYTFSAPSPETSTSDTECKIELKAATSFTDVKLPADATATITIQHTDAYLSFWGDNLETVEMDVPDLEESDGKYIKSFKDYIGINSDDYVSSFYSFDNNRLAKLEEIRSINEPAVYNGDYQYTQKLNGILKKGIRYYNLSITESYIVLPDNTQENYDYESTDKAYLGEAAASLMDEGGLLYIKGNGKNTNLLIMVKKNSQDGKKGLLSMFEYTPKQ